ncbi:MAG: chloride channel protein [Chroococcidiopsidaceae cyanobacterium CP_BM_RX_35]|nr:chloride channel protein [Chroococcidiopsidaceae cyanobacterium CP_BM_RX_35]
MRWRSPDFGPGLSAQLLVVLLLLKLVLTAISLGSGFGGGVFAPAMFL